MKYSPKTLYVDFWEDGTYLHEVNRIIRCRYYDRLIFPDNKYERFLMEAMSPLAEVGFRDPYFMMLTPDLQVWSESRFDRANPGVLATIKTNEQKAQSNIGGK